MTLVVGALSNNYALQVSDRRLTRADGSLFDDESNKQFIFEFEASRYIVGFSGLAETASFRTRDWLGTALRDAARPDYLPDGTVGRLAAAASATFATHPELRRIDPVNRRLSIMLTGFVSTNIGTLCSYGFVTNFQDFERGDDDAAAWPEFRCHWAISNDPTCPVSSVQRVGLWQQFSTTEIGAIKALVIAGRPPEAVVGKTIEIIREIADRPTTRGTVGKQLMSAVILADFAKPGTFAYDTGAPSSTYYMPTVVVAHRNTQVVFSDATLTATGPNAKPFVFPKRRPNELCSCGSGKKYKLCHGARTRRL